MMNLYATYDDDIDDDAAAAAAAAAADDDDDDDDGASSQTFTNRMLSISSSFSRRRCSMSVRS